MPEFDVEGFEVNGRKVNLKGFTGEVMDDKQWATTAVYGSGGGSRMDGSVADVSIGSVTTTHNQLIVRGGGEERVLRAAGANIAVRLGHRVSILYGRRGQSGPWLPVGLHNHETRETAPLTTHMFDLVGPTNMKSLFAVWLPLTAAMAFVMNVIWAMIGLFAFVVYERLVATPRRFAEAVNACAARLPPPPAVAPQIASGAAPPP